MDVTVVGVFESVDGRVRAVVHQRGDGMFQVDLQRLVAGDGEFEPREYWSPAGRSLTLADTRERAAALALEMVGRPDES